MSIKAGIDYVLRHDATLTALVGGSTSPRIYPMQAPENAVTPYIVFTVVSDTDSMEFFGEQNAGQPRVQISAVGTLPSQEAIADRIRTLLRYFSGTMGTQAVWSSEPVNRREEYRADTKRYVWTQDFTFHCTY